MQVSRVTYSVDINQSKRNGQNLSAQDYINLGYMAGRYGINLDGNLKANYKPVETDKGMLININSCTADLFENNLKNAGIKFNKIA